MNLSDFSFGAPVWLWGWAALPLLAVLFVWAERRRRQLLERLVASRLMASLAGSISPTRRRLKFFLMLGAFAALIAALAAPRYGYTFQEAKRRGRDLMLAIDTSRSMLATDVSPDRLTRAKLAAQDLIAELQGDRVGLVAFAGSAFLQAPLTVDESAVLASLRELDTDVIPLGGSNLAEAIRVSLKAFGKGESDSRALVLFTDGEELDDDVLTAARQAAQAGVRIFTVGIGSADGSLIPVPKEGGGTEFVRDPQGNYVKSRLDEEKLRQVAGAGNGFYVRLNDGPAEMKRIFETGIGQMAEVERDERMARTPIERYQWPLGAGIVLMMISLLLNERRRTRSGKRRGAAPAAVLAIALLGIGTGALRAQSVQELYGKGEWDAALGKVEEKLKLQPGDPQLRFNEGTLRHAKGEYDAAIEAFSKALAASDPKLRAKAEYNLGTTLLERARQRENRNEREADLKNAVQHLDEALKLNAQHKAAEVNREIARKALEATPTPTPPTPTPSPTPPDQKKDDQKKDDQQKDDQQKDDQQKDDQQKDDQKKDDQQKDDQQKNDQQKDDQQKDDQQKDDQQKNDQQKNDQQKNDQQKNDQQKNDQQKDDQQKDDQQKDDQQKDDQQKNDQQKDDQQKDDQQKDDQQKDDQQKDDQQKDDQQKDDQQKDDQQKPPAGTPSPTPTPSGDMKEEPSQPQQGGAGAAPPQPVPGEMSEDQAKAVLDSLRGEDDQPFKATKGSQVPHGKNW